MSQLTVQWREVGGSEQALMPSGAAWLSCSFYYGIIMLSFHVCLKIVDSMFASKIANSCTALILSQLSSGLERGLRKRAGPLCPKALHGVCSPLNAMNICSRHSQPPVKEEKKKLLK